MITRLRYRILEVWTGSERDLARAASIPQSQLSKYCTGRKPIPPDALISLSQCLFCNPSELVGVREFQTVNG